MLGICGGHGAVEICPIGQVASHYSLRNSRANSCQMASSDIRSIWQSHMNWSRDGTWEAICTRKREMVSEREGHEADPSGAVVDARSVRGAATVTGSTRGYDAGKKISGSVNGLVDTLGLLVARIILAASVSDNAGGIEVVRQGRKPSERLSKIWCDGGFKKTFVAECRAHHISAEVVKRIHSGPFEVLPPRRVVARTWS
jgi:hypothetical protein